MRKGYARRRAAPGALALAAIIAGPSGYAHACESPPEAITLRIEHAQFGNIGRHTVEFSCEDDALVVDVRMEIEVKILVATAYQRDAEWREVWRGDQLVAFDGTTVEGGETYEVSARLQDDRMIIEGPSGRIEAPASVVPDHPWNEKVIDRPVMFDVRDGYLLEVEARPAGEETIAAGGGEVEAQKYVVTGDLERELWYAEDGRWLQQRLERAGGIITLTRQPG